MTSIEDAVELAALPAAHTAKDSPAYPASLTPEDALSRISSVAPSDAPLRELTLPPIDGGRKAWTFIASATTLEIIIWGYSFSYGVYQDYLPQKFPGSSPVAITTIGTIALALEYSCLIFLINIYRRYPEYMLPVTYASVGTCSLALLTSSFATSIGQLIMLQGVLYGLGAGVMYAPAVLWLYEWFSEKRGLAGGIIFAGSGIGGGAIPLILGALLDHVGYDNTLRIWAAITAVFGGIAMLGLRPRLPLPPKGAPRASMIPRDFSFFALPLFWAIIISIILQAVSYLSVSLYLSPFTTSLGFAPIYGQVALSVFNVAAVAGQIGIGFVSDRRPYPWVMLVSALASCIVAFSLWGFANSIALVFVFAVLFGASGGGFSSVWPAAATDIARRKDPQQAGFIFSFFAVAKAIAAIAGPAIAGSLYVCCIFPGLDDPALRAMQKPQAVRSAYGQFGFESMTLFVGSTMLATCITSIVIQLVRRKMT